MLDIEKAIDVSTPRERELRGLDELLNPSVEDQDDEGTQRAIQKLKAFLDKKRAKRSEAARKEAEATFKKGEQPATGTRQKAARELLRELKRAVADAPEDGK